MVNRVHALGIDRISIIVKIERTSMTHRMTTTRGEDKPAWRKRTGAQHVHPSPLLRGKRAVIVEDEGMTVWQLKRMLSLAEIIVVGAASDGREGVEVVLRERPDLVLMDV